MFDSSAQRANMVFSQLRTNDVKDPRVLAAVEKIPREQFVPAGAEPRQPIWRPVFRLGTDGR